MFSFTHSFLTKTQNITEFPVFTKYFWYFYENINLKLKLKYRYLYVHRYISFFKRTVLFKIVNIFILMKFGEFNFFQYSQNHHFWHCYKSKLSFWTICWCQKLLKIDFLKNNCLGLWWLATVEKKQYAE